MRRALRTGPSRLPLLIVARAVALNRWLLFPEVHAPAPLNDGALHLPLITRAAETFTSGELPFNHWNATWVLGFPVFQYYQHAPHLIVAVLHRLSGGRPDAAFWFHLSLYIVLSVLPLPYSRLCVFSRSRDRCGGRRVLLAAPRNLWAGRL